MSTSRTHSLWVSSTSSACTADVCSAGPWKTGARVSSVGWVQKGELQHKVLSDGVRSLCSTTPPPFPSHLFHRHKHIFYIFYLQSPRLPNTRHFIFHILIHIVTSMYISHKHRLNILTSFFPYKTRVDGHGSQRECIVAMRKSPESPAVQMVSWGGFKSSV